MAAVNAAYAEVRPRTGSSFWCRSCQCAAAFGESSKYIVLFAALNPGDTIMGMSLAHGEFVAWSTSIISANSTKGELWRNPDIELIDFSDQVAFLARQHKPKLIIAGM